MDTYNFQNFYKAIDVIKSRNALLSLKVADFPNLKKEEREKVFRDLHKRAFPKSLNTEKPLTTAELARKMARAGFNG